MTKLAKVTYIPMLAALAPTNALVDSSNERFVAFVLGVAGANHRNAFETIDIW